MLIRTIRFFACLSIVAMMVVVWFPHRYLFELDLRSTLLQVCVFAASMFFWTIGRAGALGSDPYLEFRSGIWSANVDSVGRNVVRLSIEMTLFAALLELGQIFLAERRQAFGDFFLNAIFIIGIGLVFYGSVVLALRTKAGKRLIQMITTLD